MCVRFYRFVVAFFLVFLSSFAVQASEPKHYTQIEIKANKTNVNAGDVITLAIEQTIHPGWHVYWVNPGDSGEETKITWRGVKGLSSSPFKWPIPKKISYEGLVNYGYEDKVTLLQDITLPDTIENGPLSLVADISLLVCEDICIPEYHTKTLTLNAGKKAHPHVIQAAKKALPQEVSWPAFLSPSKEGLRLTVDVEDQAVLHRMTEVDVLFEKRGAIAYAVPPQMVMKGNSLTFSFAAGDLSPDQIKQSRVLLAYKDPHGVKKGVVVEAHVGKPDTPKTKEKNIGFLAALALALLGGMILNLMPCVFPVLSLKALSLVSMSDKDEGHVQLHGLVYTAGILLSFLSIAGLLLLLKAGGQSIGWGFQLQNPLVIATLTYLMFLVGLNLAGFFEVNLRVMNIGQSLAGKDGMAGSFFTGVLAAIVATPCTAPFMGVAIGYAMTQPPFVAMTVFGALGFGLALPYLLLCYVPALRRVMPKPGAWMQTLREFLSFPMFITAAWLLWVLGLQAGHEAVLFALCGMIGVAMAIWMLHKTTQGSFWRLLAYALLVIGFVPVMILSTTSHDVTSPVSTTSEREALVYSPDALEKALAGDAPVFVNMTAAWCITCKVNERVALKTEETQALFKEKNMIYMVGDWTNRNPEIAHYLERFDRNGVPIYVYYGERNAAGQRPDPVVLPQILTPALIEGTINAVSSF